MRVNRSKKEKRKEKSAEKIHRKKSIKAKKNIGDCRLDISPPANDGLKSLPGRGRNKGHTLNM